MRTLSLLLTAWLTLAVAPGARAQLAPTGPPTPLAGGPDAAFQQPRFSPDGTRVAFTTPGYTGLWVLDRNDGSLLHVTDEPAAGYGFAWSPDGTALLTRVARIDGHRRRNAVKVFDLATGEAHQLTDFNSRMPGLPTWTAAGRVALPHEGHLQVLDVPGAAGKATPDDAPVFYLDRDRVTTAHPDAPGEASTLETIDATIINLTQSPDGTRLAFEVMGGDLMVMETGTGALTRLGAGHRPQWSPDGQWIAFMRTEDDGEQYLSADLWAARADGTATVRLTDTPDRLEMNPSWSPDGRTLAFDALDEGVVYLLPLSY